MVPRCSPPVAEDVFWKDSSAHRLPFLENCPHSPRPRPTSSGPGQSSPRGTRAEVDIWTFLSHQMLSSCALELGLKDVCQVSPPLP